MTTSIILEPIRLTILVPTHTADDLDKYLLSETSLKEMGDMARKLELSISVCGQGAFTPLQLLRAQMKVKYNTNDDIQLVGTFKPLENPARLTYLRQSSANFFPRAHYYLIQDHNCEWQPGSARRYLQAISFLKEHPEVAMIFCGSSRGKARKFGEAITPYNDPHNSTSRGILVRNDLAGTLYPLDTLYLAGSADESVLAVAANLRGLWVYKQWNNPTKHHPENLRDREKLARGKTIKNNVHNWDVANMNCFRWVKEQLGIPMGTDLYGKRFVNGLFDPKYSEVDIGYVHLPKIQGYET